jgi:hypothetical protein
LTSQNENTQNRNTATVSEADSGVCRQQRARSRASAQILLVLDFLVDSGGKFMSH